MMTDDDENDHDAHTDYVAHGNNIWSITKTFEESAAPTVGSTTLLLSSADPRSIAVTTSNGENKRLRTGSIGPILTVPLPLALWSTPARQNYSITCLNGFKGAPFSLRRLRDCAWDPATPMFRDCKLIMELCKRSSAISPSSASKAFTIVAACVSSLIAYSVARWKN